MDRYYITVQPTGNTGYINKIRFCVILLHLLVFFCLVSQAQYQPFPAYSFSPSVQLNDAGFADGSFHYSMQQSGAPLYIGLIATPPNQPWRLMCQQTSAPFNGDLHVVPRYTKDTSYMPVKVDYSGPAISLVDPVVIAEGAGFNYDTSIPPLPPPMEINLIQITARIDRLQPMATYGGHIAVWLEVGEGAPVRYDFDSIYYSVSQTGYFTASLDGSMGFGSGVKGVIVSQSTPRVHVETNRAILLTAQISPLTHGSESIGTSVMALAVASDSNGAQQTVTNNRSLGDVSESVNLQTPGVYDFYFAGKISIDTVNPAGSYSGTLTVSCVPF